ncbi:DUF4221 domain-containing protein [Chryseotalea sanaruensis]|uniref:DUF4221 domain-containing protein n=1 Tax=Chryseotalea sanaruensis TaxID=2482724 RepID=A0A401U7K9_9BACT|nr:DUF4221 family protein [Chryseotalea sanaruensis]GCC50873.1 DUF4221 domain-containing protein [Chryseotalea sanaruensis]
MACSNTKTEQHLQHNTISTQKYTLVPYDTLSVPIDSLTSNFYPLFQFRQFSGQNVLAIYSSNAHRIYLYNFATQQNFQTIALQNEGPHAVPQLQGFHLHKKDSIFLFTFNHNNIQLVDSLGQVTDNYNVDNQLDRSSNYEAMMVDYFDPSYIPATNLLTFWISPFIRQQTSAYYQFPLAVDYDIKQKMIIRNYGYYPDFFKGDDIYFLRSNLQRLLTDDYDIHYFDADHNMYLYHPQTKELVKTVYARSKYLPARIEASTKVGNESMPLQKQRNYNITNGRYDRLLFDKDNSIFYRFVRHPQELLAADGLMNGKLTNDLSVLILDRDFGVAGEVLLPANVFMDDFCFVSDGLLWININHPNNPMNEEHSLKFIAYKPLKL